MFREKNASWEKLHQVMNDAGLMLETSGKGLIVRGVCGDEKLAVKSSRVHPSMTLSRLEPALGTFVPPTFCGNGYKVFRRLTVTNCMSAIVVPVRSAGRHALTPVSICANATGSTATPGKT